jgi:hypothetical protein
VTYSRTLEDVGRGADTLFADLDSFPAGSGLDVSLAMTVANTSEGAILLIQLVWQIVDVRKN